MNSLNGSLSATRLISVIGLLCVTSLFLTPAHADDGLIIDDSSIHERSQHVDVTAHAGFFGRTNVGVGGWYYYPILPDGIIPTLNDELSLVGGAYLDYSTFNVGYLYGSCSDRRVSLTPLVGGRWDFHLTDKWTASVSLKAGYSAALGRSTGCSGVPIGYTYPNASYVVLEGALGGYWKISDAMSLALEFGNFGFGAGIRLNL